MSQWGFKCGYCDSEESVGAGGCDACRNCKKCGKFGGCHNLIYQAPTSFASAIKIRQLDSFTDDELKNELQRRADTKKE